MRYSGKLTPEQLDAVIAQTQQQVRDSAGSLPLFGLAGWTGVMSLGEWIYDGGPHTLAHGDPGGAIEPGGAGGRFVQVQSDTGDPRHRVQSLQLMATMEAMAKTSTAVDLHGLHSEPARLADRVVEIIVDATPVLFELWDDTDTPGRWWAAGTYRGCGLAIEASSIDPAQVSLVRVTDLEPYLAGQAARIGRLRRDADTSPDTP
ncbi:MAG: hypothetical protein JWQ43_728 [Glaciihabitans sp.]|nr:hypothetical protein [Glaciihabitans sp.]